MRFIVVTDVNEVRHVINTAQIVRVTERMDAGRGGFCEIALTEPNYLIMVRRPIDQVYNEIVGANG
jgi:hypothetical protein